MKKIFITSLLILYSISISWAQCPATVTISGVYSTTYTGSNSWIATSGTTTITTGLNVTLDANPLTNGYVLLDAGFETQPNSEFLAIVQTPCALSPVSVCLPVTQDAMIHEWVPNTNYGTNNLLVASRWTYSSGGGSGFYTVKALHQFDLTSIPTGSTITSAFMKLHVDVTAIAAYNQHYDLGGGTGNGATIEQIGSAWNEGTVTWNTAPSIMAGATSIPSLGNGSTADVVVDVTAMIQNMITTGVNNGFMTSMTDNSDYYHNLVFASRDNTSAGGIYQPELCVTFNNLPNEQFITNTFMVYPNPANDIINISGKTTITKTEVYSTLGKLIFSNNHQSNQAIVNIKELSSGMYLLKVTSENGTETKKILKN